MRASLANSGTLNGGDRLSELVAEGWVPAVEAVQWLHPYHVEDSVLSPFEAEYAPKTERAVAKLRAARASMAKAAALGGPPEITELAMEVAVHLAALDEGWHEAQDSRRKMGEGSLSKRSNEFFEQKFDEAYRRFCEARQALTGFDHEFTHTEIGEGMVRPGSLLYRLRSANSDNG